MTVRQVAIAAGMFAFVVAGSVAAQVPVTGNMPGSDTAPPSAAKAPMGPVTGQGAAPPPADAPRAAEEPPCLDFQRMSKALTERADQIKAAADLKAPIGRVCQLLIDFAVANAKVVKFASDNQSVCKIPPDAIRQMKDANERVVKTRDKICRQGAGPLIPLWRADPLVARA